jgi:phosphate acetyltransferase
LEGEALVLAPLEKIRWDALPMPEVQIKTSDHNYEQWLLDKAAGLKPLKVAVVHPVDIYSLSGAVEASKTGVIEPILIGLRLKSVKQQKIPILIWIRIPSYPRCTVMPQQQKQWRWHGLVKSKRS